MKNTHIKYKKWLARHTASLKGKTVAVTGSTGGLGKALCHYLAYLGADLILIDRNRERAETLKRELTESYDSLAVTLMTADMADMTSVKAVTEQLKTAVPDVLICNAGAYSIPRKICDTGYDNVFQINFVSPYYMIRELEPVLAAKQGRVVVVGSIAHNYSKTNPESIDFADRPQASKVYGNAKRYLMYALCERSREVTSVCYSITHPGISFTGITNHYPRVIFALIKHPMKVIFMKPEKACLSTLKGVFDACHGCEWIGPRLFDVWGFPKKKKLTTARAEERAYMAKTAERIYREQR